MKILFQTRSNLLQSMAGDTIQVLKTREYLRKKGFEVDLSSEAHLDLSKYQIIHIFNTNNTSEMLQQFANCKKQGKAVAVSTIYWDMTNYILNDKVTTTSIDWWYENNRKRKEVFAQADILLPNSEGEYIKLSKDLGISNRYHVVPNGVDREFLHGNPHDFIKEHKVQKFILCVGRIAYRKNQLSLIRALKGLNLAVVFIGSNSNRNYYNLCRSEADENFHFIDEIPHNKLAAAYAAAQVHVLPSWFETPGLANLEAALAGCNIVSTVGGTTREYFKDYAIYCDPSSLESIRDSVLRSMERKPNRQLQQYVLENFTWEKTADSTLKAYEMILK